MNSSRTADKFVMRLPDGMRERIAERAKLGYISMNTFCILALEQMLDGPAQIEGSVASIDDEIGRMIARLEKAREVAREG